MEKIISLKNIIIYLVIINLIGFLAMFIDKTKAKRQERRIKEKTLLDITLLGGGIGSIIGMYVFRHKTKKYRFVLGFPIITIIEMFFLVYYIIKYY